MEELTATAVRLRSSGDGLRWSKPESWHVTLQFLGNAREEQYECVAARLRELRSQPVRIVLEGLGYFDRAGVLFVGVKPTPELVLLQKRVTAATETCGFMPDLRPYHPHITLARSKGKGRMRDSATVDAKARIAPKFARFVAQEFLLYESILGAEGSHYKVRARFPLVTVS